RRRQEGVPEGMGPEHRSVEQRPVVVPADVLAFEDAPLVAADVKRVADRKEEEDEEEEHRQRDEPVPDERLADALGAKRPFPSSLCGRNRHGTPPAGSAPPRPRRVAEEQSLTSIQCY